MEQIGYYEAQANTIKTDDIVLGYQNRLILQSLRREWCDTEAIHSITISDYGYSDNCYVPENTIDVGWFGFFIGRDKDLTELFLCSFGNEGQQSQIDFVVPLFKGLVQNTSIKTLNIADTNLFEGRLFTMLQPLFANRNSHLTELWINTPFYGEEGRLLAVALEGCSRSLEKLHLDYTIIPEEQMAYIITVLGKHHKLRELYLEGNFLGKTACNALATFLKYAADNLECLGLDHCDMCDEGLNALTPALSNQHCCNLDWLDISHNESITAKGWHNLGIVLSNSNLTSIDISGNAIDDEAVSHLTECLAGNCTLTTLTLDGNQSITEKGLRSISQLLCDTSSINQTFLSNHTLTKVVENGTSLSNHTLDHVYAGTSTLLTLLELNDSLDDTYSDTKEIAITKILKHHNDFDLSRLFEWEYKFLPLIINWFEAASSYSFEFEANIEQRKLSSMYKFIRAMPLLYVEMRLRKELEDIKSTELNMNDEALRMEKEQRRLELEQLLLDSKRRVFDQRKRELEKRKINVMKKLRLK